MALLFQLCFPFGAGLPKEMGLQLSGLGRACTAASGTCPSGGGRRELVLALLIMVGLAAPSGVRRT